MSDNQDRLAEAQRLARLGSWSYHFERRRVDCSEEACQLIGLDAASPGASLTRCLRRVHRADRRAFMAAVTAAARRAQGFEIELRALDSDGKTRWLHLVGLPMVNPSAKVCQVRGTVMDVTQRKRAELRQSLEHKVAQRLAQADSPAEITPRIIKAACLTMGWDCGVHWSWDAEREAFACGETWTWQ